MQLLAAFQLKLLDIVEMTSFARALAWFSGSSFFGVFTQVVKGKASAVFLGPLGVGIFSQLTQVWTFLEIISGLGFYNGIVKRLSEASLDNNNSLLYRQLWTSLIFLTVFSCVLTVVGVIFSEFISGFIFSDEGARASLVSIAFSAIPFSIMAKVYKGLLSSQKLVRSIVLAQIVADFLSLLFFVFFVYAYGLWGAVVAFSAMHFLKLIVQMLYVKRSMGPGYLVPNFNDFKFSEVSVNIGYGINGIVMSGLSIGSVILVSKWIISDLGAEQNGFFSVAWRVGAIYLGALYAAAGGFYYPSLVGVQFGREISDKINEALGLYLRILVPLIVIIILGGKYVVLALFSSDFLLAATIMALMLPGDLFRVSSETIGLAFLAKGKVLIYSVSYFLWVFIFVFGVYFSLPAYGLVGVALSYLVSHFLYFFLMIYASRLLSYEPTLFVVLSFVFGLIFVSVATFISMEFDGFILRLASGVALLSFWGGFSCFDSGFRAAVKSLCIKLSR